MKGNLIVGRNHYYATETGCGVWTKKHENAAYE